jgi:hypothetical protein
MLSVVNVVRLLDTRKPMLTIVNKVDSTVVTGNVEDNFKDLFHGVGKLKEHQVMFHIDESARPVALKPHRTPFYLRSKVAEETQQLVDTDIIEQVEKEP